MPGGTPMHSAMHTHGTAMHNDTYQRIHQALHDATRRALHDAMGG